MDFSDFYDYTGQKIEPDGNGEGGNNDQQCEYSTTKLFDPIGTSSRHPCAGQLLFKEDFRDLAQLRRMQWTVVEQFSKSPVRNFQYIYT